MVDIKELERKAKHLGATEFGSSKVKGKRFYVIVCVDHTNDKCKRINFGSDTANTFVDHKDENKRSAWRARHSKIKLKTGEYAYKVKEQPEFWSWNILW
jgi:hypothetical protein